jgi:ABC-type nitrate/sulfonate/bicarbonate transport system substrate-binding protein
MRRAGIFAAAMAMVLAACSTAPGASPGATDSDENIIYFGSGATQAEVYLLPMLMAGRDILEEQGITVEYAALSGDEVVSAALDRGRIDVALLSLLGAQRAIKAGLGLQWTLTNETQNVFVLVVPDDVTDLTQLRGKKLGVQDATSLSTVLLPALMMAGGVQPDEYETVFLAGSSNRAAALAAGTMDGSILLRDVAVSVVEAGGFQIWGEGAPALDPMMWEGFVMSDEFIANERLSNAFIEATLQAYEEFYAADPAQLAEEWLGRELAVTEGLEVEVTAEDFRQYQEINLFPTDGGLDEEMFNRMNELLVEVDMLAQGDTLPYADVVDSSVLERVQ